MQNMFVKIAGIGAEKNYINTKYGWQQDDLMTKYGWQQDDLMRERNYNKTIQQDLSKTVIKVALVSIFIGIIIGVILVKLV